MESTRNSRPQPGSATASWRGSIGPLVADFAVVRAIAGRDRLLAAEVWVVLRRTVVEDPAGVPELKYYLSNAAADTPLDTLVWLSGMRWPIECCFAECKSELGLDHYEMRFWPGWHHHMTLVLLAHHFLVRLQQRFDQREGAMLRPRPDLLPQTTVYLGPTIAPRPRT